MLRLVLLVLYLAASFSASTHTKIGGGLDPNGLHVQSADGGGGLDPDGLHVQSADGGGGLDPNGGR